MQTPWLIEVHDELYARLEQYPYGARGKQARTALEKAIHKALDASGWPQGDRGTIAVPAAYWYVNIWNRDGSLKGHVGPIPDAERARTVARSWRQGGCSALHTRIPHGKPLTQPGFA